jgi:hypothetical protein
LSFLFFFLFFFCLLLFCLHLHVYLRPYLCYEIGGRGGEGRGLKGLHIAYLKNILNKVIFRDHFGCYLRSIK